MVCGRSICRECSNWVAENVYICPTCWQSTNPTPAKQGTAPRAEKTTLPPKVGISGALSRALYYATAVLVVALGFWYSYATFIAPTIAPSGAGPSTLTQGISGMWDRNRMILSFSAMMFIIVFMGGELMLRTGSKQRRAVATQPEVEPVRQSVGSREIPITAGADLGRRPGQSQSAVTQPEARFQSQISRAGSKPSQPAVTQPEVQAAARTRLVYCIHCGNRITSTAVFCDGCGKGQK